MYKFIVLSFLVLAGCMQTQKRPAFVVDRNHDAPQVVLQADEKNVVFTERESQNSFNHALPVSLHEVVQSWLDHRFVINHQSDLKVVFDVQTLEMTKTPKAIRKWYVFNNEEYVLTYQIRFSVLKGNQVAYYAVVKGHVKEQLPVKASLMDKEKLWADMISRMILAADNKLVEQIPDMVKSS